MKKCCLCNKEFIGHGHNPVPLCNNKGVSCTKCNITKVLPTRIMFKIKLNGKDEKYPHNDGE
mgnify:FL=1